MTIELFSFDAIAAACGGAAEGAPTGPITGFAIDTRELAPGEVFVALTDRRDGHEFVPAAFAAGAAAAIVRADYAKGPEDGALLRVADPLGALNAIAALARARAVDAQVVAITGSVGKTSTKEAIRASLERLAPTHAAVRSFNNHWGVPLTLARMPADTRFAVIEMGMNHAGEIRPLTRLARPHLALVTSIGAVHIGNLGSLEAIADAKAEIFEGLEPGATAVIPIDVPSHERLAAAATARGLRIVTFGDDPAADVRPLRLGLYPDGSDIVARTPNATYAYRLGAPGAHLARNSLAVVAVLEALGVDVAAALAALADLTAPQGRGARVRLAMPGGAALLIDESYNGQPPSMRAAILALGAVPRSEFPRRVAVLGDMLELGADAPAFHRALKGPVDEAGVDLVFACGREMRHLFDMVEPGRQGEWAETSDALEAALLAAVTAGDAIVIKGSLGTRMAPLVAALKARFAAVQ